jgi:acyl-CoA thioester hydrolase
MSRPTPYNRSHYPYFSEITTRWNDNDPYGHVNNMVYYAWFDSTVNEFLIKQAVLDIELGTIVGLVVKNGCDYFSSLAFPDRITVGMRLGKLGNSSVTYELGIFRNDDQVAAAQGHFVHVYVDRNSLKPQPLSEQMLDALKILS